MPGGGCWEVGPGQITDDSEMAMCLARALSQHEVSTQLPVDDIAAWYGKWLQSPPFDIGITTSKALAAALPSDGKDVLGLGQRVINNAAQVNQQSQSNGGLMRITPLAVWSHTCADDVITEHARRDTSLTHPDAATQDASATYCLAIAHLINHPGDSAGAFERAQGWASGHAQPLVVAWLQEAVAPGPGPAVHPNDGWVHWGFVLAFRALHLQTSYSEAIRHVLLLGGDTDTNAAIVGGMVGALHGATAIPSIMKDPVLNRTSSSHGRKRPDFLQGGLLPGLFDKLYAAAGGTL
eukprot:jgi/Chrzof1/2963/Cz12g06070.t1